MSDFALLPDDRFLSVIRDAPLVSIDLLIMAEGQVLLGRRKNCPAQGYWFVPGGRVLKYETLRHAFARISVQGLGTRLAWESAVFDGVFEHFYADDSYDQGIGTHYVVLAYALELDPDQLRELLDGQYSHFEFFGLDELRDHNEAHALAKQYFDQEFMS